MVRFLLFVQAVLCFINPSSAQTIIPSYEDVKRAADAAEHKATEEKLMEAEVFNERGLSEMNKGNYEAAIGYFNSAIEIKRNVPWFYTNRAHANELKGDIAAAVLDLTTVLEEFGFMDMYWIERGRLKTVAKDFRGALSDFEHVLDMKNKEDDQVDLSKTAFVARIYQVMSLNGLRRYEEGLAKCEGLLNDLLRWKEHCRSTEFYDQLCKDVKEVLPDTYTQLGILYYNSKRLEDACLSWSKAGELGEPQSYEFIRVNCQ